MPSSGAGAVLLIGKAAPGEGRSRFPGDRFMHFQIEPLVLIQQEFVEVVRVIEKAIHWVLMACPKSERAEAHHEAIALSWSRFRRLAERGLNPTSFPSTIGRWAAIHVLAGRKIVGSWSANCVMSFVPRNRLGFSLERLDGRLAAALVADDKASVAEQAAFRIDFRDWLSKMSERDRGIAADLACGSTTKELAAKHRLSEARISQKRREFAASWSGFHAGALKT